MSTSAAERCACPFLPVGPVAKWAKGSPAARSRASTDGVGAAASSATTQKRGPLGSASRRSTSAHTRRYVSCFAFGYVVVIRMRRRPARAELWAGPTSGRRWACGRGASPRDDDDDGAPLAPAAALAPSSRSCRPSRLYRATRVHVRAAGSPAGGALLPA